MKFIDVEGVKLAKAKEAEFHSFKEFNIIVKSFDIGKGDFFLIRFQDGKKYFNLIVDCGKVGMSDEL